ncbi:MAG: SUMF1/EgtB/PvdO family nonheme iron enzyme, partial [Pirellulales bacterium]|nr:SUMF1/EgtB/PvdO family nonheme iron enzyme [Pirellulales bacterium]
MTITRLAIISFVLVCGTAAYADTFGSGSNTFDIEFVTIGNPGNADDFTGKPSPAGKVDYTYRIGKFEISEDMIDKANTLGSLGITKDTRGPDKPATSVSWLEAAQFVNWLNTSSGSTPAYKFDDNGLFQLWEADDAGYNPNNLYRNTLATYFLPSMDEWYKAAYYDPSSGVYYNHQMGSNALPIPVASGTAAGTAVYNQLVGPADITQAGGLSPYSTMGQGGNVWEWEETDGDLVNDSISNSGIRGRRGGSWRSLQIDN